MCFSTHCSLTHSQPSLDTVLPAAAPPCIFKHIVEASCFPGYEGFGLLAESSELLTSLLDLFRIAALSLTYIAKFRLNLPLTIKNLRSLQSMWESVLLYAGKAYKVQGWLKVPCKKRKIRPDEECPSGSSGSFLTRS